MQSFSSMTEQELWQNALVQIELGISQASFRTWFRNTGISRREGGEVFIAVPSKIVKEWLREKHHKLILKALRSTDETVRSVDYIVQRVPSKTPQKQTSARAAATIPMQEMYIDKRDNLNPRYTFDTFIVGPFNQLAHAATQAIMENPGLSYNPLFIYGKTGRGKTHLIQAVGNHFKKTHQNKKVFYVTSERFRNDLVESIRSGRIDSIKTQYRQYDVLIMDDIQFLADAQKTQEELFHLFNALYDNNKQIVFSSDTHPSLLPGFEDRLKGRFSAGMTAEITEVDFESRLAIIRTKMASLNFSLEDSVVDFIAEHMPGNIREIEGVLNAIICKTQLDGRTITEQDVRSIIKNSVRPQKNTSVEQVVKKVSQYYEIEAQTIYDKTRKKEVVKPRQMVMYILREEYGVSYPSIGEKLGGRDHTTVIHSCEKIKEQLKRDSVLEQELDQLRTILNS